MNGELRRVGAESSAKRVLILDATQRLILEEGYAAVSTRRVAAEAGLKPSLVHYYFPTTDDLLLELLRRGADESDRMIEEALQSGDPIRAFWRYLSDSKRITIALEFMALANQRKSIRNRMAEHCEEMRCREVQIFTHLLGDRLDGAGNVAPPGFSLVLAAIGRVLVMEEGLGVTSGHAEARAFVEKWLDRLLDPDAVAAPMTSAS